MPVAPLLFRSTESALPSFLSIAVAAITRLNRLIFLVTSGLMVIIVPVMLYEVVCRYLFDAPTVWAMELAVLLFGPYFLLGGPYLLHLRGHVALDLARQRLSPLWQRRLDLVNYPIIMLFCLILLVFSAPAAYSSWMYRETSFTAWNVQIWPVKLAVPLALLLMLLQAIAELLRVIYRETALDADTEAVHP
jgi:TRAP-type mannitol/chloroaromatic compound transport system permease small subunit